MNVSSRKFLISISLLLTFEKSQSQNLFVTESPVAVSGLQDEFDLGGHSYVNQTASAPDSLLIHWDVVIDLANSNWDFYFCDMIACYDTGEYSGDFNLPAGFDGLMKLGLRPNNYSGTGTVYVNAFAPADSINFNAVIVFDINVEPVGIDETDASELVSIFQNEDGNISIRSDNNLIEEVSISDLSGRELCRSRPADFQFTLDQKLVTGLYLIHGKTGSGVFRKKFFSVSISD